MNHGNTLAEIRTNKGISERDTILRTLRAVGGNVAAAAKQMGLSRYQLIRRINKYGLRGNTRRLNKSACDVCGAPIMTGCACAYVR